MSLVNVEFPYNFAPGFDRHQPIASGYIYIGEPDLDPEIGANQKTIYFVQEDGNEVVGSQPIRTSAGGVPTYNGSPVAIKTEGDYSIKVLDKNSVQVYYSPNSNVPEALLNALQTVDTLAELPDAADNSGQVRYVEGVGVVRSDGSDWVPDVFVTPAMFGAKGDDSTDDAPAINLAMATGVAVIFDGSKTYRSSGFTPISGTRLLGRGARLTQHSDGDRIITVDDALGTSDVEITGFVFDGQGIGSFGTSPGTDYHGFEGGNLAIYAKHIDRWHIHHNEFRNLTNIGISIDTPLISEVPNTNIWITDNFFTAIGGRNTGVNSPYVRADFAPGEGLPIAIGDESLRTQTVNKLIWIARNRISNALNTLISVGNGDSVLIQDNILTDTDSNFIQVSTNSSYVIVTGNICKDCTCKFDPTIEGRGISIHPTATGVESHFVVSNNIISKSGLYAIDLRGERMVATGNQIFQTGINNTVASPTAIADINADPQPSKHDSRALIANNRPNGSQGHGILLEVTNDNLAGISIVGNHLGGTTKASIQTRTLGSGFITDCLISANYIDNSLEEGINLSGLLRSSSKGNYIYSASTYGISVNSTCDGVAVTDNHIYDSGTNDLRVVFGAANTYVKSNTFDTADIGNNSTNTKSYGVGSTISAGDAYKEIVFLTGAGGTSKTFTLPPAQPGMRATFYHSSGTGVTRLDPDGSELFLGQAAGKYAQIPSSGAAVIECVLAGTWSITPVDGVTVTYEP